MRLGAHPEVAVCLDCARFLQRRATENADRMRSSVGGRVRSVIRRAREWVIVRRLHERGWFGSMLRRPDRHLP